MDFAPISAAAFAAKPGVEPGEARARLCLGYRSAALLAIACPLCRLK